MRTATVRIWKLGAIAALLIVLYGGFVFVDAWLRVPDVLSVARAAERMSLQPDELSGAEINALLVVEDPGFEGHCGVDLSTPGAGLTTITQALVKVYYFDSFKPGLAKIPQTIRALALDARMSKRDQLTLFLGSAYFGSHGGGEVIGFEQAARVFFGKDVRALEETEWLSLVATIIAPNRLQPARHAEANRERVLRIERLLAGRCKPRGVRDVHYLDCGQ